MLRFLRWTVVVLLVGLAGLLITAALRPDAFTVSRSRVVQAAPERIFPLIEDMRAFNTWNPFVVGQEMPLSYEGPAKGPGALCRFGPGKGGTGMLTVIGTEQPRRVTMKLDMQAPLEAHNDIAFNLQPEGNGTRVTWSMQGVVPFVGKIVHVVVDMDRMVGGEMDKGLASLARLVEK